METSWPAAARFENLHHWPSLRKLESVTYAVWQKLVLSSLEPALSGYPAVMLKQVYRHLAYIDYHPRRIGFLIALLNNVIPVYIY